MTRDDARDRITDILGFRKDMNSHAERALREAQGDFENGKAGELPWFLYQRTDMTLAAGATSVALPTDFLREASEDAIRPKFTDDFVVEHWLTETDIQFAQSYSATEDWIFVFHHYRADAKLFDNKENRWLKHASELLIGAAGGKLAGTRDKDAMATFAAMMASGITTLLRENAARKVGGRRLRYRSGGDRQLNVGNINILQYNDVDIR